ncbi:hypothetical protein ACFY0F_05530 [Streptomyces sp. NPDC001544]|uniref:hypothetical protein n=1 Tax=Streptomyces sp. NPDC001544 TaxID=3364584 RepID=UPI00369ABB0A
MPPASTGGTTASAAFGANDGATAFAKDATFIARTGTVLPAGGRPGLTTSLLARVWRLSLFQVNQSLVQAS